MKQALGQARGESRYGDVQLSGAYGLRKGTGRQKGKQKTCLSARKSLSAALCGVVRNVTNQATFQGEGTAAAKAERREVLTEPKETEAAVGAGGGSKGSDRRPVGRAPGPPFQAAP